MSLAAARQAATVTTTLMCARLAQPCDRIFRVDRVKLVVEFQDGFRLVGKRSHRLGHALKSSVADGVLPCEDGDVLGSFRRTFTRYPTAAPVASE